MLTMVFIGFTTTALCQAPLVVQFNKHHPAGRSVQPTPDGGFLLVSNVVAPAGDIDVRVIRTDENGDLVWDKRYGGPANEKYWFYNGIQVYADGSFALVAQTRSFGTGSNDVFFVRADNNGDVIFMNNYGGASFERGVGIDQTTDGGYIITGQTFSFGGNEIYLVKTDASGNLVWERDLSFGSGVAGQSVRQTTDGGYIIAAGGSRVTMVKTDPLGFVQWVNNSLTGIAYSGRETPSGDFIFSADDVPEAGNARVIKLDNMGNIIFDNIYDPGAAYSVENDPAGGFIVSYRAFGAGMKLLRLDDAGNTIWEELIDPVIGNACSPTPDGGYIALSLSGNLIKLRKVEEPGFLSGKVYADNNDNCSFEGGTDFGVGSHFIEAIAATGESFFASTDDQGNYLLEVPEGAYTLQRAANQPHDFWELQTCQPSSASINVTKGIAYPGNDIALRTTDTIGACIVTTDVDFVGLVGGPCIAPALLASPCNTFSNFFCVDVENDGPAQIPANAVLDLDFGPEFNFGFIGSAGPNFCPITTGPSTPTTTTVTFPNPINPGASCRVCAFVTAVANGPYTVTADLDIGAPGAMNLVVNGDFSAGAAGFLNNYTMNCDDAMGNPMLGIPFFPGHFCVGTNANDVNGGWAGVDNTTGTGNFLYADGSLNSNDQVWCQNVNLTAGVGYTFDFWALNLNNTGAILSAPNLQVMVNGVPIGTTGNLVPQNPGAWTNYQFPFVPTVTGPQFICISSLNNSFSGNDFGIDDIQVFESCDGVITDVYTEIDNCACDPNDKMVVPVGCGPQGNIGRGEELTYMIRFENIGFGNAHNVFITDKLDSDLDISSFRITGSSHQVTHHQIYPSDSLVIRFDNIELPGIGTPDSNKGYVVFDISPKSGLPEGAQITNEATIYFDYNEPVITNTTLNTIREHPAPIVAFSSRGACTSEDGLTMDFTYTGGTAEGASFFWDFGPNASPATSTDQNPQGVIFSGYGQELVTLSLNRYGCSNTMADFITVKDNTCTSGHHSGSGTSSSEDDIQHILICHYPDEDDSNSSSGSSSASASADDSGSASASASADESGSSSASSDDSRSSKSSTDDKLPVTLCIPIHELDAYLARGACIGACDEGVSRKIADTTDQWRERPQYERPAGEISIQPNPNSGYFSVKSTGEQIAAVSVVNILGKEVYHRAAISESTVAIDLSSFSRGIYFIKVRQGNQEIVRKVVYH